MPSGLHEGLTEFVEAVPGLLPELLRRTSGRPLPEYARVVGCSETATITVPTEHRADTVRVFTDAANKPVLVTVVEVQLRPEPPDKETKPCVWPVYLTNARREHKCQTVVLVIVPDTRTAAWARKPLDLGLGCSVITPLVVDLSELRPVVDLREATANIGLAVLAALSKNPPRESLDVLSAAFAQQSIDEAKQYAWSHARGAAGRGAEVLEETHGHRNLRLPKRLRPRAHRQRRKARNRQGRSQRQS